MVLILGGLISGMVLILEWSYFWGGLNSGWSYFWDGQFWGGLISGVVLSLEWF